MAERVILFGGSFDPVHVGHTTVAEHVAGRLGAARTIFVPARRSPHKSEPPVASPQHRVNMLSLAVARYPSFSVSRCELERLEPSYTYDTVADFRRRLPEAELFWLVGADTVASLPQWHRVADLMNLCEICVMSRGGLELPALDSLIPSLPAEAVRRLKCNVVEAPAVPVSSTEVRRRLKAGLDVSKMLDPAVLEYIIRHKLYGTGDR
jgi:nicotinate-nucleotide adenylyltransferase